MLPPDVNPTDAIADAPRNQDRTPAPAAAAWLDHPTTLADTTERWEQLFQIVTIHPELFDKEEPPCPKQP